MEPTAAGDALLKGTASDDRYAAHHRKRHHQQTLSVHRQGKCHNGPRTNNSSKTSIISFAFKINTVFPFVKEYIWQIDIAQVLPIASIDDHNQKKTSSSSSFLRSTIVRLVFCFQTKESRLDVRLPNFMNSAFSDADAVTNERTENDAKEKADRKTAAAAPLQGRLSTSTALQTQTLTNPNDTFNNFNRKK